MNDNDLNKWLDSLEVPAPRADLSADILAATSSTSMKSNQKAFTKRFMPIAATIVAVSMVGVTGFKVVNNNALENEKTETALWQEAALDLGFDDIYNWVESEEASAQ